MLIVGAPYDVFQDQTIKDAFVGDSNQMWTFLKAKRAARAKLRV